MNNIVSVSSVTTNKLFLIFVMIRFNREKLVSQHSCKSISLPMTSEQRRIANARKPTEDGEQRLLLLRPPVIFAAAAVSLVYAVASSDVLQYAGSAGTRFGNPVQLQR